MMIEDFQQLAASVNYMERWADTLEGLRLQAQEGDSSLLSTHSAGPISEIRRVLAEARSFLEAQGNQDSFLLHPAQRHEQAVS